MNKTVHESLDTLKMQVAYLEYGTNPVIYFPPDTPVIPQLPTGAKSLKREIGVFYFNPKILSEKIIDEAIAKDALWLLLGYVQDKGEAIGKGAPIAIVARDAAGNEVKTAVVDSNDERLASLQAYILYQWFPNCSVSSETVFGVIAERLHKSGIISA